MWHRPMWQGDGWGWWMVITLIWIIAFLLIIAWAVRALTAPGRSNTTAPRHDRDRSDALDILDRRYAGGEITEEEYERVRRRILTSRDDDQLDTKP